jgi:hypothetical protein
MSGHDPAAGTAENYRAFAREARGRSGAYERLAEQVAEDAPILRFLDALPRPKRQPNLLFAAARYLTGEPPGPETLRQLVSERPDELGRVMLARRTQTNEVGRCAVLLPALAALPPPLALLEVGASAGLTLLPDRYSYDYAGHRVAGTAPDGPLLRCQPSGPVPLPAAVPRVVWRAGLDLAPLDVRDDDDVRWLACLVWPDQPERARRLEQAVAVARADPPRLVRGDLLDDLPDLAARAPADATLVVCHSAVLAYVAADRREAFAAEITRLRGRRGGRLTWLANEAPGVTPEPVRPGDAVTAAGRHGFVLLHDGARIAVADRHGAWLHWVAR